MKSLEEIRDIASKISYKNWRIDVKQDQGGRFYLQVVWYAPCVITEMVQEQKSRKWWLSTHMTKTEIVNTVFKAVMGAEEHEVRENFKYCGKVIFNPHFDVDKLYDFACDTTPDYRS